MNFLGVIPARGGSKSIPRKNLVPILGKPLILYTIEAALGSKSLDKIIVSTDDEEIKEISLSIKGVEVIDRPRELATETTPTIPVLEHVLDTFEGKDGYKPDAVVLLQPTSPLRNSRYIDEAIDEFLKGRYDSLLSVAPSHAFLWRAEGGSAVPVNYDPGNRQRRQDRESEYRENGAIYIAKCEILRDRRTILGGKIGLYVMSEEDSFEIDTEFDLWLCKQVLSK